MAGRRSIGGLTVVGAEHLIPLKARAYLDLAKRRERGEDVKANDVKTYRNDVLRLLQIVTPQPMAGVPEALRDDVRALVRALDLARADLVNLGVGFKDPSEVVQLLGIVYSLEP